MTITKRDIKTLADLDAANRHFDEMGFREGWARPMDCGGSDGSHHGATLAKLARLGLAERKGYTPGCRVVWAYKITAMGREKLSNTRELA